MSTPHAHKALTDMARRDLRRWARVNADRDQLVRNAAASGVTLTEIHRITGIARTTIDRILGKTPASSAPDRVYDFAAIARAPGLSSAPLGDERPYAGQLVVHVDVFDGLTQAEVQDELAASDYEDLTDPRRGPA